MKKLISLVLVAMMLLVSCVAVADSAIENADEVTEAIGAALESGTQPKDVFGEDAKAMLALYMPAGTNLDKVTMGDVSPIEVAEPSDKPVQVEVPVAEVPAAGVAVIVLGDAENGYTCVPVKTEVIDGKVMATLSPEMQQKLAEGPAAVAMTEVAAADIPNYHGAATTNPDGTVSYEDGSVKGADGVITTKEGAVDSKSVARMAAIGSSDPDFSFTAAREQTEATAKVLSDITNAIVNGTAASPVEALGEETVAKVKATLPENVTYDELELNEAISIQASGALNETTKIALDLPTEYEEGDTIVAVFTGAEGTQPTAVPGKVVDGVVILDVTPEAANTIGNDGTVLIFND